MKNKHLITLDDWITDEIKYFSKLYHISFSEAVRVHIALGILKKTSISCPEYPDLFKNAKFNVKFKITLKQSRINKKNIASEDPVGDKIYFEARKAAEYYRNFCEKRKIEETK